MSLTTLSLMAGALGGFPPTPGATIAVALRSREETRRAALKAEAPHEHGSRWVRGGSCIPGYGSCGCCDYERDLPRDAKRAARKIRMARKRRRGWL